MTTIKSKEIINKVKSDQEEKDECVRTNYAVNMVGNRFIRLPMSYFLSAHIFNEQKVERISEVVSSIAILYER